MRAMTALTAAPARRLAILGGGQMGGAILARVLAAGLYAPADVIVSDADAGARSRLEREHGVRALFDAVAAAEGASCILVAVKPQVLATVGRDLHGHLTSGQVVLSIAAGIEIDTIRAALGHDEVVRAMPNTPAQVGQGVTAWCATASVSHQSRGEVRDLLRAVGTELEVDAERYLDMVTAVSGSGPAWAMLVIEAMTDAGVNLGLRRDWAYELVLQTFAGSVALARETGRHPADLRNSVTTPGGTTAAGLAAMERAGARAALADGIEAAYRRAVGLGAAARSASGNAPL
jgi:pyrroline-5-carboxylate reductase